LATFAVVRTYAGHASLVKDVVFEGDSMFSCAEGDRFISRWSLKGILVRLPKAGFRVKRGIPKLPQARKRRAAEGRN
jgi:hypothetical protein